VTERLYTIPVTCCRDGQAHDVTDESAAAGRATGDYQALCGYVVVPAAMAAPVGRPCERCTAVLAAHQPTPTTAPVRRQMAVLVRSWRQGAVDRRATRRAATGVRGTGAMVGTDEP
jgi:hypothetical protein